DGVGIDLRAVEGAGEDAYLLLAQEVRLFHKPRDQIECDDAFGNAPIGKEVDCLDVGPHCRGRALGLAGNNAVTLLDLITLNRLELEGWDVDQNVALFRILRG